MHKFIYFPLSFFLPPSWRAFPNACLKSIQLSSRKYIYYINTNHIKLSKFIYFPLSFFLPPSWRAFPNACLKSIKLSTRKLIYHINTNHIKLSKFIYFPLSFFLTSPFGEGLGMGEIALWKGQCVILQPLSGLKLYYYLYREFHSRLLSFNPFRVIIICLLITAHCSLLFALSW